MHRASAEAPPVRPSYTRIQVRPIGSPLHLLRGFHSKRQPRGNVSRLVGKPLRSLHRLPWSQPLPLSKIQTLLPLSGAHLQRPRMSPLLRLPWRRVAPPMSTRSTALPNLPMSHPPAPPPVPTTNPPLRTPTPITPLRVVGGGGTESSGVISRSAGRTRFVYLVCLGLCSRRFFLCLCSVFVAILFFS